MQKAVIIYSTTDGQTKRICEFLMQKLKTKMQIDLFSIDEIDQKELKFYDKIKDYKIEGQKVDKPL